MKKAILIVFALSCFLRVKPDHYLGVSNIPDQEALPLMVKVEGKYFEKGQSPALTNDFGKEVSSIKGFYISRYEITREQYNFYLDIQDSSKRNDPVVGVLPKQARAYAKWAGGRLPRFEEWLYAARGGHVRQDTFEYAGSNDIFQVAWVARDYMKNHSVKPVGLLKSNSLGLYDLNGNAMELLDLETFSESGIVHSYALGGSVNNHFQNHFALSIKNPLLFLLRMHGHRRDYTECKVGIRLVKDIPVFSDRLLYRPIFTENKLRVFISDFIPNVSYVQFLNFDLANPTCNRVWAWLPNPRNQFSFDYFQKKYVITLGCQPLHGISLDGAKAYVSWRGGRLPTCEEVDAFFASKGFKQNYRIWCLDSKSKQGKLYNPVSRKLEASDEVVSASIRLMVVMPLSIEKNSYKTNQ